MDGYNRYQQQAAYDLYKEWTGPGFPRVLVIQIQHPTPFYDDSYAVNSANAGPWGDAIVEELIPHIEKKYRGIGQGWARFMYGGSTGGWEALAAQVFYPDAFNGAYAACPDPIDFRAYTVVNLYEDTNAYYVDSRWKKTPRPGLSQLARARQHDARGHEPARTRARHEDALRAAVGRVGGDVLAGRRRRLPEAHLGQGDRRRSTRKWRRTGRSTTTSCTSCSATGRRASARSSPGKVNLYVGDMDNYYLNNAVYLAENFLRATTNPWFDGEVTYGDRAEHCWNGDPVRPNYASRLRYHQMFIPKAVARMEKTAPKGADIKSWRY